MSAKASSVLMIRPVCFSFNTQTASSNFFQVNESAIDANAIQAKALAEFDAMVILLRDANINVIVVEDSALPQTPDSIFPNNWISFHDKHTLVLYPMMAENRRLERRLDIVNSFTKSYKTIIDITHFEKENRFLEGTGSLVMDYKNRIIYACASPRTNKIVLDELAQKLNMPSIFFEAYDANNQLIYHTNVMLAIGDRFIVLCDLAIKNGLERKVVCDSFQKNNLELILITLEQMNAFAGNCYQLFDKSGNSHILMSEQAYLSLTKYQIERLSNYGKLLTPPLYTIEKYGGGSARCMIAEIR